MARLPLHNHFLVPISVALLLAILAGAAAAAHPAGETIKVRVHFPTDAESQWVDRWAAKYSAEGSDDVGSGGGVSVDPATGEESAYLNSLFSFGGDGGVVRSGFEGHLEFDHAHPYGRIVVDAVHSRPSSSKPKYDLLQNQESPSHAAEYDVKDL